MRLVRTLLTAPAGVIPRQGDAELIRDAMWVHATPGSPIVHITTTVVPAGIDLAVFIDSSANDPAHLIAAIFDSIRESSARLGAWLPASPEKEET